MGKKQLGSSSPKETPTLLTLPQTQGSMHDEPESWRLKGVGAYFP